MPLSAHMVYINLNTAFYTQRYQNNLHKVLYGKHTHKHTHTYAQTTMHSDIYDTDLRAHTHTHTD